jgi:Na+/melibiose symporter-like transporter
MSSTGEGRTRKLGFLQYLGYGVGDAANNLTFMMVSSFLLLYYTDVAAIPAATAGTVFLVVRIWGGLTDLFAGRSIVPAVAILIGALIMFAYPLTEDVFRRIVRETATRRAAGEAT